jgi:hypothetical protein
MKKKDKEPEPCWVKGPYSFCRHKLCKECNVRRHSFRVVKGEKK